MDDGSSPTSEWDVGNELTITGGAWRIAPSVRTARFKRGTTSRAVGEAQAPRFFIRREGIDRRESNQKFRISVDALWRDNHRHRGVAMRLWDQPDARPFVACERRLPDLEIHVA